MQEKTGNDAGLSGLEQIEIALRAIVAAGGMLKIGGIYSAINNVMNKSGSTLSFQGQSSLRFFINRVAVKKGLIYPYDKGNPGWHITEKGRLLVKGSKIDFEMTLPTEERAEELSEGNVQRILVNKYERNSSARKKCIAHYGAICQVCDFEFSNKYGDIGLGFIHVHHVIPLHEVKGEYIVDPINDLIPLCPNCHSMIHCSEPMLTVNELRERISIIQSLLNDI